MARPRVRSSDADGLVALWLGLAQRLGAERACVLAAAADGPEDAPIVVDDERLALALLGLVSLADTVCAQLERSREAAPPASARTREPSEGQLLR